MLQFGWKFYLIVLFKTNNCANTQMFSNLCYVTQFMPDNISFIIKLKWNYYLQITSQINTKLVHLHFMENTITYIVITILMVLTIAFYNYKKKRIRQFLLSQQHYPELNINIYIEKNQGDISAAIVSITANKDIIITDIKVEVISKKREFNYYSLQKIVNDNSVPLKLSTGVSAKFTVPFIDFKSLLMDGEYPFKTFRFLVASNNKRLFKSHEMGFDKRWTIYRPDTGSYN